MKYNTQDNFYCPLPYLGISLDAGLKRRLCCHDITGELEQEIYFQNNFNSPLCNRIIKSFQQGIIPKNCKGCALLEEQTNSSPRLQYLKQFPHILTTQTDIKKYIDITFDNQCNLACLTCHPFYSNKFAKFLKQLNIKYNNNDHCTKHIFKKYFTSIKKQLIKTLSNDATIVITGGEPSISLEIKYFLQYLKNYKPIKQFHIRLFTNLTTDCSWITPFFDSFLSLTIIASIDAIGNVANYIRYPSDWQQIKTHLTTLLEYSKAQQNFHLEVHTVISILNITHICELCDELLNIDNTGYLLPSFTLLSSPSMFRANYIDRQKYDNIVIKLNKWITEKQSILSSKDLLKLIRLQQLISNLKLEKSPEIMQLKVFLAQHEKLRKLKPLNLI